MAKLSSDSLNLLHLKKDVPSKVNMSYQTKSESYQEEETQYKFSLLVFYIAGYYSYQFHGSIQIAIYEALFRL